MQNFSGLHTRSVMQKHFPLAVRWEGRAGDICEEPQNPEWGEGSPDYSIPPPPEMELLMEDLETSPMISSEYEV